MKKSQRDWRNILFGRIMLHQSRAAVDTTLTDQVYARAFDFYAENTKN